MPQGSLAPRPHRTQNHENIIEKPDVPAGRRGAVYSFALWNFAQRQPSPDVLLHTRGSNDGNQCEYLFHWHCGRCRGSQPLHIHTRNNHRFLRWDDTIDGSCQRASGGGIDSGLRQQRRAMGSSRRHLRSRHTRRIRLVLRGAGALDESQ